MNDYEPGLVYNNLVKMMNYRGVKLNSEPFDSDALVQKLNHYEFATIVGTRDKSDPRGAATVIAVLIAPKSKYANTSGNFKKLLSNLPKVRDDQNLDVIFVSEMPLTIHIKKLMIVHRLKNPKVMLEDHSYEMFLIEKPKHASVPLHIIATDKEINDFCNKYKKNKNDFGKILQSDVQAVWLGLRPGMCVKIIRISENAGNAIAYRICIKG
ncbi:DNA-directed RNA polymerase subunit h [Pacmanvirus S19]|nr:DNA-directed RNA polymerase subunit h [Pacmanvirus S19]